MLAHSPSAADFRSRAIRSGGAVGRMRSLQRAVWCPPPQAREDDGSGDASRCSQVSRQCSADPRKNGRSAWRLLVGLPQFGIDSIAHYLCCPIVGTVARPDRRWHSRAWPGAANLQQAPLLDGARMRYHELVIVSAWHDAAVSTTGTVHRRGQEGARVAGGVEALHAPPRHSAAPPIALHVAGGGSTAVGARRRRASCGSYRRRRERAHWAAGETVGAKKTDRRPPARATARPRDRSPDRHTRWHDGPVKAEAWLTASETVGRPERRKALRPVAPSRLTRGTVVQPQSRSAFAPRQPMLLLVSFSRFGAKPFAAKLA